MGRVGRATRTTVAAGHYLLSALYALQPADFVAAQTRLQHKLETVAAEGTKHRMMLIKTLEGAVLSLWAAAKRSERTLTDALFVDYLTDDKARA